MKEDQKNNHHRKKEPEKVRKALLNAASSIIIKKGVYGLTLDEVARKSKVSKGGLLYHFPNKQALLNRVFDEEIDKVNAQILEHMQQDPHPYARFTRAYLALNNTQKGDEQHQLYMLLTLAMMTNEVLRKRWIKWFDKRVKEFGEENEALLSIVRLAADGLWLSDMTQTPQLDGKQRQAIFQELLQMTLTPT